MKPTKHRLSSGFVALVSLMGLLVPHATDLKAANILVYKYSALLMATGWNESGGITDNRDRARAYIIYNPDTGDYNSVSYYTENGDKLYCVNSTDRPFSQAFLGKDSRGRDHWVIGLEGPGEQWTVGDDYAQLDTLSGRAKRLRFRVAGEFLTVDDISTYLRGGCRYEEVDTTLYAESRYAEEGKVGMRFDRKLSVLANDPDDGGDLEYGRSVVIDYLESKGYEEDPDGCEAADPVAAFMEFVTVGDPGNAADTTGYGAVAAAYRIGRYEVTNAQYAAFLNAVATTDTNGLYSASMDSYARGGITQSGSSGSFSYAVKANMGNKPVIYVSFWDACRFCNWLHNGMPSGAQDATTTEDGAYDLTDSGAIANNTVARKAGARYFLPSEDQWYKAAYYSLDDGDGSPGYWLYPTQSDTTPTIASANSTTGDVSNPGVNVANYDYGADWNGQNGNVTSVGSAGATSHYGASDMGGNVYEWNEAIDGWSRGLRGGSWLDGNFGFFLQSSFRIDGFRDDGRPANEGGNVGFRVAGP